MLWSQAAPSLWGCIFHLQGLGHQKPDAWLLQGQCGTQGACAATHCKTHLLPPFEGLCGPGNGPQISRGWERFPEASDGLWPQGAQGQGAGLAWGHHQGELPHSLPRTGRGPWVQVLEEAWSPEMHFSRRGMGCGLRQRSLDFTTSPWGRSANWWIAGRAPRGRTSGTAVGATRWH